MKSIEEKFKEYLDKWDFCTPFKAQNIYKQLAEIAYNHYTKQNKWYDCDDPNIQEIFEVNPECDSTTKPLLAQNDKGKYLLVYAICEEEDGDWSTGGYFEVGKEYIWRKDIVRLKKIYPDMDNNKAEQDKWVSVDTKPEIGKLLWLCGDENDNSNLNTHTNPYKWDGESWTDINGKVILQWMHYNEQREPVIWKPKYWKYYELPQPPKK